MPLLEYRWNACPERVFDPFGRLVSLVRLRLGVELLGSAALSRWYTTSKAKYDYETDSEQVP